MFIKDNLLPAIAGILPPGLLYRTKNPVIIHPFYHTVSDEYLPHIHPLYALKKAGDFEKEVDYVASFFETKSLAEVYTCLQKPGTLKKNAFHLSFDDGLRGVYEIAMPILCRKGISATVFVNTDFVDNRRLFYRHKTALLIDRLNQTNLSEVTRKKIERCLAPDFLKNHSLQSNILSVSYSKENILDDIAILLNVDFREYLQKNKPYLTVSELKEMQEKGFTIGAHSLDHPPFQQLDESEQIRQTLYSCAYVKKMFNEPLAYFSFPFSDEGIKETFFEAIRSRIDLSFGITGISFQNQGKHLGRINMEKQGQNAREIVNKAFLKYRLKEIIRPLCI